MTELEASRTLVKSPPELWAECSDAASLTRHLGQFGEIRITRLDPETAVAWEGERARGTVRIEPAGWGTKVILTAVAVSEEPPAADPPAAEEPADEKPAEAPEEPEAVAPEPAAEPPPRRRRFARFRAFLRGPEPARDRGTVEAEPETEPVEATSEAEPIEATSEPEPSAAVSDTEAALAAALDSLGQAHHRPYSRA
jgi:hypothetical protein